MPAPPEGASDHQASYPAVDVGVAEEAVAEEAVAAATVAAGLHEF